MLGEPISVEVVAVGEPGLEFARRSLRGGQSLARAAAARLAGARAEAVVPPRGADRGLLDFRRGGLGQSVIGDLAGLLTERFPSTSLVVELPLWRPADRDRAIDSFETFVKGSDVYAVASVDEPISAVEAVLRSADPAFLYHAFVIRESPDTVIGVESTAWPGARLGRLAAAIVGAYDGEGFVLAVTAPAET